jgi:hypothetical protein
MAAYFPFVLSCVGTGLAVGRSLIQGVLPIVYKRDSGIRKTGDIEQLRSIMSHKTKTWSC